MKWNRWRGGVHPAGRKEESSAQPIRRLPLPELLFIPLQQHVGEMAMPVVGVGQRVLKGQLLAAGQGNISAPLHAPTSGLVRALGEYPAPHPSGLPLPTLVLEVDGDDRWVDLEVAADPFALAPEDVCRRVGEAGIVGLGGATFPSAVKLELSLRRGIDTLVINGGECEPYLTSDDLLMRERAAEVITGARLIRHAVQARQVLLGVEDNKPEALAALRLAALGTEVEVQSVPSRYPMGSDKQLVKWLTGREIPAGGRAADAGVLVHNVATAYSVARALVHGQPLVSRIVTLAGGAMAHPGNWEVPFGTLISRLIEGAGGYLQTPARLVMGGPMMGMQLPRADVPVVKGCSGVLALSAAEVAERAPEPCVRCANCVRGCPQGLMPLEMAAYIRNGDLKGAQALGLKDCIGCGACSYICPSNIPLTHYFNYARNELATMARQQRKLDATRRLAEQREARFAREQARLAARRAAAMAQTEKSQ
ncbi:MULTISPECIES: electron transport complex subunit RsxC [Pseudomonas]|uniref:electron transport complex subunit RsxC n=1 Tax=Pseudomonas TaxID=286 RepID=UPI00249C1612|nr:MULTISPECIES: electron transport complex subunit RsxC [Pseudomonas]